MIHRAALLVGLVLVALGAAPLHAAATEGECLLEPRSACFGVASVKASLSTSQAGDHPDVSFDVGIAQDPASEANSFGLHNGYATTRDIRFNFPPGLVGDPNTLGVSQQCTEQELIAFLTCPIGSQIGTSTIAVYQPNISHRLREPLYMMHPPGGDVVARVGTVAGIYPTFIDLRVRSEGDYGLVAEVHDAPATARLMELESTLWGVPADPSHDTERCYPPEALGGCVVSVPRPPGSRPLPFTTNPTRCGVPLQLGVNASSWVEPEFDPEKEVTAALPTITGCNRLPFGPSLAIEPTNHRAAAPTGLDVTVKAPASDGVNVLEPSQTRDIRVKLPEGMAINPSTGDGLEVCTEAQVKFGERVAAQCPDAAKMGEFEAEIGGLPRRMRGAIYLRDPEPGNPFRIWAVADDLGAHVKLPGRLIVDKQTGQIESVLLETPQFALREVKVVFKSGFRAPLVNPSSCGSFAGEYEFTPWSGGPAVKAKSPIAIGEGCEGLGGFAPKLSAGTIDPAAGGHSPFLFTLTREDGEQNPSGLEISTPAGFAATFAGIPRCEGSAAETGACPAASRIGRVVAAVGAGPHPLWVPQEGKRPTAIYLSGPYKGAPLSVVAVVPRQAGPFDFGDEVVRSAIFVDPSTARATVKADPLPQLIEGIPITYRTLHVMLDREGFALNPTSCAQKATDSTITSSKGAVAHPSSPFEATNCAKLGLGPELSFRLRGATHRGAHPQLQATLRERPGDANLAGTSVALPHSEFLDQAHIKTVCTRVQFAARECPAGSIYGYATAKTPLFDETLSGPVYLRSSNHPLPDLVVALKGPASLPIEVDVAGRVDSVNGGIRTSFEALPDAPVSSFTLNMQGGKKGLLVNSTDICAAKSRATVNFSGQNGDTTTLRPRLRASCAKKSKRPGR
jgi:hypothetical protein